MYRKLCPPFTVPELRCGPDVLTSAGREREHRRGRWKKYQSSRRCYYGYFNEFANQARTIMKRFYSIIIHTKQTSPIMNPKKQNTIQAIYPFLQLRNFPLLAYISSRTLNLPSSRKKAIPQSHTIPLPPASLPSLLFPIPIQGPRGTPPTALPQAPQPPTARRLPCMRITISREVGVSMWRLGVSEGCGAGWDADALRAYRML